MTLKKQQLHAMGYVSPGEIPVWLWSSTLSKLYEPVSKGNIQLGCDGQTYQEFIEMGNRPPNEEGTGRMKFSQVERFNIIVIPKSKQQKLQQKNINILCEVLEAYTTIRTAYRQQNWTLSQHGIIDHQRQQEFTMQFNDKIMEVQPLLSLLIEFKQQQRNTVALVQRELCEEGEPLDGRACGDGVAAASYEFQANHNLYKLQDMIETVIHETLHTLGFDHCLAWSCLMNGIVNSEVWLCPACMKKLHSEIGIEVEDWYKGLISVFRKHKLKRFLKKGQALLKIISQQPQS